MAFRPVPQVDSAIVRLLPREDRPPGDSSHLIRLAEGLFNNRRKKVKKGLAAIGAGKVALAGLDADVIGLNEIENTTGVSPLGDPTNGIVGSRDLIRVAVARDPSQAVPLSGTFVGEGGDYAGLEVQVNVTPEAGLRETAGA